MAPPVKPKPLYSSSEASAYWDVLVFAEHHKVRANRVDARVVNHATKQVMTLEMSCPWISNRTNKDTEKTLKYGPLCWELKQQYPGYQYKVEHHNGCAGSKMQNTWT